MDAILVNRLGKYSQVYAVLIDSVISNILIKLSVSEDCFGLYIYKEIAN